LTLRSSRLATLFAVAAILALGLGLLTLAPHTIGIAGAAVLVLAAGAVFAWLLGVRTGLLILLIATCFIDRFTYRVGSVNIRAEQLAALVGLAMVAYWFLTQRRWELIRPTLSEGLLGGWFAIGLISSLTAAPQVGRSLKGLGLLLISSLGLILPRRLLDKENAQKQMDATIELLLIAFAAEGAYGTAAFLAHVFGSQVSLAANVATGHLSAYGTLWEPNVFGAICTAGAVAWAWLGPRHFQHAWLGIALCLGGTIVSFTRAAWVAAFVVLALSALARTVRVRASWRQLMIGIGTSALIALVVFGAERVADYYIPVAHGQTATHPARLGVVGLLENPIDVIGRLDQVRIALPDIRAHPLLGSGIASFGELHPIAGQPEQHIANLGLTVLNDTGALGLLVFAAFGIAVAVPAWRHRRDATVVGLGMSTLVIAITNMATETTELMITWLLLGLVLMAVDASDPRPIQRL
jgi:hypothetical protein